ncbi:hypothetical protein FHR32_000032 [Streptosporangium album]|uniref:Lipoprotein n=1 Tax=Streptosporangium album TaxID=47479 RepID=A0A7W7W5Y8_9ACTN|nr:hypothetical protein [Streptosporangium album]MBB4935727.1 hypothetical protein [Streptosporangium album]
MAVRKARFATVPVAAMLAMALLSGCGGDKPPVAVPQGAVVPPPAAASAPPAAEDVKVGQEYNGECPQQANARRFAKTRFALHAGLGLGAFYRYIYKPLRSGGFQTGADKRTRTFLKAAVAGAFALHEMKIAKGFAVANPTLCKGVQAVSNSVAGLTGKLKGGTATGADLDATKNSLDALKQKALNSGYDFKARNVTVPGAS